ncbi:MAG TPA: hypothetical protein ENN09_06525 [Planctomycetes bacterium]|nr:hypothetical protein [Planctomycetota bacterium]
MLNRILLAILLCSGIFPAAVSGETGGEKTPPPAVQDNTSPKKLSLELLLGYLGRWEIKHMEINQERKLVMFDVRYENMPMRFTMSIAGDKDNMLVVSVRNVVTLKEDNPGFLAALKIMAVENYNIIVGCWGWDPSDGEVTLDYTFVAASGLAYADFETVLDAMLSIAESGKKKLDAALNTAPAPQQPASAPAAAAPASEPAGL